jgi:SAM-dependent methyltransferase
LIAASALPQVLAAKFFELYGPRLVQGYGLSEAVNFSFTMPINLPAGEYERQYVEDTPPVGWPMPNTTFRIVDKEVQVKGPCLMSGYWKNPEATQAAFTDDGYLRTGDLGMMRENYLVLIGRSKEIIIRGGENFSPVQVEADYAQAGLELPFCVAGAYDDRLGESIGLVCERPVCMDFNSLEARVRPSAVAVMPVPRTATGKPQRRAASQWLCSLTMPPDQYEHQRGLASWFSRQVLDLGVPTDPRLQYIYNRASMLADAQPIEPGQWPLDKFFSVLAAALPGTWNGNLTGHDAAKGAGKDGWEALMVSPPMGLYPEMVATFMRRAGLLKGKTVLELGAGVGNLSRLIHTEPARYIRSDLRKSFLAGQYSKEEMYLDFDQPFPSDLQVDVVVAVNALHCASDPALTLAQIHKVLKPGGHVVLGEGNPFPSPQGPWALDVLFGFFDGWWDRGGFRSRTYWLQSFKDAGFGAHGYGVLRAGHYDLGGLLWSQK